MVASIARPFESPGTIPAVANIHQISTRRDPLKRYDSFHLLAASRTPVIRGLNRHAPPFSCDPARIVSFRNTSATYRASSMLPHRREVIECIVDGYCKPARPILSRDQALVVDCPQASGSPWGRQFPQEIF